MEIDRSTKYMYMWAHLLFYWTHNNENSRKNEIIDDSKYIEIGFKKIYR